MAYQTLTCQPDPYDSASESLQYLRCYIDVFVRIRDALKRGNRSGINASLLQIMLIDLNNALENLEELVVDQEIQQFEVLIQNLQIIVPKAAEPLEAAVNWHKEYEKYVRAIDSNTLSVANDRYRLSMNLCQECHDTLRKALNHPDNVKTLRLLELDK